MRAIERFLLAVMIGVCASSCTIRHDVAEGYPQYLTNNTGSANLPKTDRASKYYLTPTTEKYYYEFRAVVTGYGNLWIVNFGEMLDDTLMSADVQKAFGTLTKTIDQSDTSDGLMIFDLEQYTFENFGAHVSLTISVYRHGNLVFSKTYVQHGKSQGGKMFWGGAFAQKNAVQQSTKLALDAILRELIEDLNSIAIPAPGLMTLQKTQPVPTVVVPAAPARVGAPTTGNPNVRPGFSY